MSSDYDEIVSHCLKNGELWEDPDFPPVQSSLFYHQNPPQTTFEWKRPHEITSNPAFVSDNFDIVQGRFGDRWLVTCLGCLRTSEGLLYRVVPADQGFDPGPSGTRSNGRRVKAGSYAGIFRFRIWWSGEWKEVMVDDRLPTVDGGKLAFVHAKQANPFWPALLEKAYAKLHGSYEALKYGTTLDCMSDLTGGIAESLSLKEGGELSEPTTALATLHSLLKMTSIVTSKVHKEASTSNGVSGSDNRKEDSTTAPEILSNGIIVGDTYRIYSLHKVDTLSGERIALVRLKCTLDGSTYRGEWSSTDSASWQSRLDPMTRERLISILAEAEDNNEGAAGVGGEMFYMSFNDWLRTFTNLEAIHLDADTARDEPSLSRKSAWTLRLYHGRWQRGVTAGGCRNNADTFHLNPRLCLSLRQPDEVVMALNQHTSVDPKVIGFTGYPAPLSPPAGQPLSSSSQSSNSSTGSSEGRQDSSTNGEATVTAADLTKNFFRSKKSLLNSQYTNSKQVSLRMRLDGGQVVVLPTTFEPGEEVAFTFRVFSKSSPGNLRMRVVDFTPAIVGSVFSRAGAGRHINNNNNGTVPNKNSKDFSQYEPIFKQVSEDKRTVTAFELQDMLEACLPNDYIKSCASIEVCRQIVVAFDSTGLGRINFANFKDLMCSLKVWHNVFKNWTKEKSGILKSERLREALLEVGFQLNTSVLSAVMFRYIRKDGTLRFGDFVAIILNLSVAFDAFDKRDVSNSGLVKVGRSEWLKVALTS